MREGFVDLANCITNSTARVRINHPITNSLKKFYFGVGRKRDLQSYTVRTSLRRFFIFGR